MNTEPLYIEDAVFGVFHPPVEPRSGAGVLLCPPFGWDDMCSYRPRREWADDLAAHGYAALRIDLPGAGNSAGSPRDPERLASWTSAVASAARWLRETAGCERVVALGIGLGGLVAWLAVHGGAAIDDLALWGVPARGRTLVRELRAFSLFEIGGDRADAPAPGEDPLPDGYLAAGGYILSAETVTELHGVDLSKLPLPAPPGRRVLLLGRDGRGPDERLVAALEGSEVELTVTPAEGWARMMAVSPQESVAPVTLFGDMRAWLAAAGSSGARATGAPVRGPCELSAPDGKRIRETPVAVAQPFGRLHGVLAEPLEDPAPLCAVLLNAGPQRQIGPNRMWVEAARRWAARGVTTLRIDCAGIGESDGDSSALVSDAGFYRPEYIGQVRAVLDELEARGLPPRFLLLGLCAGAYWSLHVALEDARVQSALLLNPLLLLYDPWVVTLRETREIGQKLLDVAAWGRVFRGTVSLTKSLKVAWRLVAHALLTPFRIPAGIAATRRTRRLGGDELDLLFDRLQQLGKPVRFLFTGEEPVYLDMAREGRLDRLDRWPNISVKLVPTPLNTHSLRPLWVQQEVHALLDGVLREALEHSAGVTGLARSAT